MWVSSMAVSMAVMRTRFVVSGTKVGMILFQKLMKFRIHFLLALQQRQVEAEVSTRKRQEV